MGIIFQKVLQHHIIVPSKNLSTPLRSLGESQLMRVFLVEFVSLLTQKILYLIC